MNQSDRPAAVGRSGAAAVRRSRSASATSRRSATRVRQRCSDSLSFFRNVYDAFAGYRAAIIRLARAGRRQRQRPRRCRDADVEPSDDGVGRTRRRRGAHARRATGWSTRWTCALEPGESLVITGQSGAGKTTLLRSLAAAVAVRLGDAAPPRTATTRRCSCRSCRTCRWATCAPWCAYPTTRRTTSRDEHDARRAGQRWRWRHWSTRLDEERRLGQGALPRRAAARRVRAGAADQTEGGLPRRGDLGARRGPGVRAVSAACAAELPDCVVVSVSHRRTVEQHHERQLELLGGGQWRLGPVDKEPAPV